MSIARVLKESLWYVYFIAVASNQKAWFEIILTAFRYCLVKIMITLPGVKLWPTPLGTAFFTKNFGMYGMKIPYEQ
ncbi:hypothetical protein CLOM_g15932 [Closterium sp. NIES-68]|nr:hypothetical protein CLOM_g15932 [Closterium sp. NIES-68]